MNTFAGALLVASLTAGFAPRALGGGGKSPSPIVMHPDTGSDTWGYTWFRSDEPGGPTFHWVDITTRGTLVTGLGDDNYVGPLPMQFAFPYYWYSANSFYIGSNGYINLTSPANFGSPFVRLPSTSSIAPKDLFAACVGDLDFTVAASNPRCYYWTNGADSLVVSFIDVTEWQQAPNPNLKHTFQIILNKRDSSITYQYGAQQGRYNAPNNTYLCIGWQNQIGLMGHSYTYSTTPPHTLMPDSGLAIKIKRYVNEIWHIYDVEMRGGFDQDNLAKIMRRGFADTMRCVVKNTGNMPLTDVPVRYAITRTGQPSAFDTVVIPSLEVEQQVTVTFPRLFTPAVTGTYSALFNVTIPGDVTPGNNSKTAEILSEAFGVGQSTLIRYENGLDNGALWYGGGGFGVSIDLPPEVYPVRVETVYVKVGTVVMQPLRVEILDGSSGAPGALLATRSVTATSMAMNAIVFTADNVVISGGRFFIAAYGDMQVLYERSVPISYRAWEYANGWRPHQSREIFDFIIRASVRGVTTDVKHASDATPRAVVLEQNFPNPFNASTTIFFSLPHRAHVMLNIFDILGREVAALLNGEVAAGNIRSSMTQRHCQAACTSTVFKQETLSRRAS